MLSAQYKLGGGVKLFWVRSAFLCLFCFCSISIEIDISTLECTKNKHKTTFSSKCCKCTSSISDIWEHLEIFQKTCFPRETALTAREWKRTRIDPTPTLQFLGLTGKRAKRMAKNGMLAATGPSGLTIFFNGFVLSKYIMEKIMKSRAALNLNALVMKWHML